MFNHGLNFVLNDANSKMDGGAEMINNSKALIYNR